MPCLTIPICVFNRIIFISVCLLLVDIRCDSVASNNDQENKTEMSNNIKLETNPSPTETSPGPPPDPPNTSTPMTTTMSSSTLDLASSTDMMANHAKGRALNLTESPLDDVSMDNEEDDVTNGYTGTRCTPGETLTKGCEERCYCNDGDWKCVPKPQCLQPYVKVSMNTTCHQTPSTDDPCCVLLDCISDLMIPAEVTTSGGVENCTYKNETYSKGETFNDACESVCTCDNEGHVSCKPRCTPAQNTTSDRCVAVPDSMDPCCTVVLCDVTLQDHDISKPGLTNIEENEPELSDLHLISAIPVNSTSVKLNTSVKLAGRNWSVEISEGDGSWKPAMASPGSTVLGLEPSKTYSLRVKLDGAVSNEVKVTLPSAKKSSVMCEYNGKNYTRGEEFYDGCNAYCVCDKHGVDCATIECPTDFGLDVLDPNCLSWEPTDFVPTPPNCCPKSVQCKSNGSCLYAGEIIPNWTDVPQKLTGCEQRCFCEMGNVTCHAACSPVSATPPHSLPCMHEQAILGHPPGDDCCLNWFCPPLNGLHNEHFPNGFSNNPSQNPNEINVHSLEALDDSSVRLIFSVPNVLVGLHGRVELRYTSDKLNSDPSTWEQQVLAPEDDLIATPELEFELGGLQPDTMYKIKIAVVLRDLENSPASKILTVKTLPSSNVTTLPAMIPVEPELQIAEINSTWARLIWRKFTDNELQFIDGVQLRYKENEDKVYSATPLIHRAVTSYVLEGLKPDSQYEIGIFFIPFPGQNNELIAQKTLHLSTTIENDPYKFDLNLTVHHIKATSVELSWSGVPYPEDKYVNIFRAIYQSEGGKEDFNSFKVAKRDSPPNTFIKGLKPNTRYRLWLEAYLTNGRIKKSNVKDFTTKSGPVSVGETQTGKLEGLPIEETNDYYGPLVAVSILAAIAIVAVVILLLILARKHGHNKAPITAATNRKVQTAAYDNPSYKTCENDSANGRTELTTLNPYMRQTVQQ